MLIVILNLCVAFVFFWLGVWTENYITRKYYRPKLPPEVQVTMDELRKEVLRQEHARFGNETEWEAAERKR